jgi:hemoglobin/transferrin/lactoferrin receptor protein
MSYLKPVLHLTTLSVGLFTGLALLAGTTARAQDSGVAQGGALREVVISGSRHEQFLEDLAVTVDVIGAHEIEIQQIQDIRDVARDLPNVSVRHAPSRFAITGVANNTGRDGNSGFNIRGLGGNRVLMMVDDVRIPHSYVFGGNAFGRDSLSIDLIKRIEVVRGPASALYGSDAMGGLVNFITHEPSDFLISASSEPRTLGGRVAAGWSGDDNSLTLAATVAGRASDTVEWMLTATGLHANGLETMGTNDSPNVDRTTANPQTDRNNAVMGKLVFRPDASQKHVLTFEHVGKTSDVNLLSSRARLPLTGTPAVIAGAVLDERASNNLSRERLTWDARYRLDTAWADHVQTLLGYQYASSLQTGTSDRNTLPDREREATYTEATLQARVQADKMVSLTPAWGKQRITYGFDYVAANITNLSTGVNPLPPEVFPLKRFPDTRESSAALYAQGEWVNEAWTVVPGLRLDQFSVDVRTQDGFYPPAKLPARSLSGSAWSPKLGAIYRATPEWNLFGNYAHGFRAPNANQVNGYYENLGEQVVIVPNANLKPETSNTVEFGLRGRMNRLSLDFAVFTGWYNDLIVDNVLVSGTGVAGDPKLFQTINTDRARIRGFEFKGSYDWGQVADGRLSMPFAYGQAKGLNITTGKPLNSVDPAKLVLGLNYDTAAWTLRLDLRHYAAKNAEDIDSLSLVKAPNTQITVPAATTVDVYGQWRIRKTLRLNVGIVNLTNTKYWMWSDVQGLAASTTVADAYTQPGRHVTVSLVNDF